MALTDGELFTAATGRLAHGSSLVLSMFLMHNRLSPPKKITEVAILYRLR